MSTFGKAVAAVVVLAFFGFLVWVPLPWQEQAKIGVVMFVAALALHWSSQSRVVTVTLMLFSTFASLRYFACAWARLGVTGPRRRVCVDFGLRPYSDAIHPADDDGVVGARSEDCDAANAASFLFARSV